MTRVLLVALGVWLACGGSARAEEVSDQKISEAAIREARGIIAGDLFGHYDVTDLAVQRLEEVTERAALEHDYGLVRATLVFVTRRNTTRHPSLNPAMLEPGNAMCQGWLYLHCGVPAGHVFQGRLQLLLAFDQSGAWRAVSPHWRSRRLYSLHGYLILDGRELEGYVLFPKPPGR